MEYLAYVIPKPYKGGRSKVWAKPCWQHHPASRCYSLA